MDQRIIFMLHQASRELTKTTDQYLMKYMGITSAQMGALFFLFKNDGCLLKDLSAGMALNNSAVTGLVGRMASNGFVVKKPCEEDGRAFRIYISEKGKETVLKGFPLVKALNETIGDTFTEEEITVILRFLNEVVKRSKHERKNI